MRQKDIERVKSKLDALDISGEQVGYAVKKLSKYTWSKTKLIVSLLTVGGMIFLYGIIKGVRK